MGGLIQTIKGGLIQPLRGGLFRLLGLFDPNLERKYSVFDDGLCHRPGALPRPHSAQRPTGRVKKNPKRGLYLGVATIRTQ